VGCEASSIGKRISVASALGVIPDLIAPALRALQKLRNDFAHGDIHELDDARAEALVQTLRETDVVTDDVERLFVDETPLNKLRTVLLFVMSFIREQGSSRSNSNSKATRPSPYGQPSTDVAKPS
jgi:hypothetical protein